MYVGMYKMIVYVCSEVGPFICRGLLLFVFIFDSFFRAKSRDILHFPIESALLVQAEQLYGNIRSWLRCIYVCRVHIEKVILYYSLLSVCTVCMYDTRMHTSMNES